MKIKKTPEQLVRIFWESHPSSLFMSSTIAPVLCITEECLKKYRNNNKGPRFLKMLNGNIIYRKSDVIAYLDGGGK